MTIVNLPSVSSDLIIAERDILTRVAIGGALEDVLRDIILMVERPSNGEMLASILLVSDDGKHLLEGAAPSLPAAYNAAVHGIPIANGVGSCGTAAFTGQPVIVTEIATDPLWADYSELAVGHGLRACWSLPILASDGTNLGTFANYYREVKEPSARDMEVISMVTRTTAIAIERYRNDQARVRAEELRVLLLRELNHRVKNLFALMDSLLTMRARTATSVEEYTKAVRGRLNALGRAHELVQPSLLENPEIANAVDIPLRQVLAEILEPYAHGNHAGIHLLGPDETTISGRSITSMALILHELATNAAKYGALAGPGGRLKIQWSQEGLFVMKWSEHIDRAISVPDRTGFGSRLISSSVQGHFGGTIAYDWRPDGVDVLITIPKVAL